jgi:hypothetical protein
MPEIHNKSIDCLVQQQVLQAGLSENRLDLADRDAEKADVLKLSLNSAAG